MTLKVPDKGSFAAFSMLVDINGFTSLVAKNELGGGITQFVKDLFDGSIRAIEESNGAVIGINGDALFAIFLTHEDVFEGCRRIAKDVNRVCEYLSGTDYEASIPELPSMKIGVEHGWLEASTISTDAMGTIPFCLGPATNYAARILQPGKGNRCHVGPRAMAAGMASYINEQLVQSTDGKPGEGELMYWALELGHIWIDSEREDGLRYWS